MGFCEFPQIARTALADKLEDRLDPGEKIFFQARYSLVQAIERALVFAMVLFAVLGGAGWLFGDYSIVAGGLVAATISTIWFSIQIRAAAALVTDRRFLFREGLWRPKVVEIPLADITQALFVPGIFGYGDSVKVRKLNSVSIEIYLVPRLEDLRIAILTAKGQTGSSRINRKIRNAASLMVALSIGSGLLGIVAATLAFIGMVNSPDSMTGFSAVAIILFLMFLLLPFIIAALILGCIVGCHLFFILARFHLSPAEAKELICWGDGSSPGTSMEKLNRRSRKYLERMLSFLYGQKIRCD